MAAYASLVFLTNLIDQIQHHPNLPLYLDQKQANSLAEKIVSLQSFLEEVHSHGLGPKIQNLESRITGVAHAVEDAIEGPILLDSKTKKKRIRKISNDLFEGLQRVIRSMDSVEKEASEIKRSMFDNQLPPPPPNRSLPPSLPIGLAGNTTAAAAMVGFDDLCIKVMERLTGSQSRKREIIPIVGMGGIGKTTLARNIYDKPLIVEYFHTRSWVTVSQEWVLRDVLIEILLCQKNPMSRQELGQRDEGELGELLHKSLFGGRYLVVLDDVWSSEAWDRLKFFLPDNNNGSRVMVTSRSSKLASELTDSPAVKVDLLDDDMSWELLCKKVFGEKNSCPLELEEVGRRIARNCKGLPLSIVAIGGLLAKFDVTKEYWEYVAGNLSSLVKSVDNEHCLRVLSLSYIHLPVHLKPCFLYMGLFPEDQWFRASQLIILWVAEGFLKPVSGKSLEAVGDDYLKDLSERNLVVVHKWGYNGEIRFFTVHDLVRDLCLREAKKEKFFDVSSVDNLQGINGNTKTPRRIAIHRSSKSNEDGSPHHGIPYSAPSMRSCIIHEDSLELTSLRSARLLRILASFEYKIGYDDVSDIAPLANLRCVFWRYYFTAGQKSISFLWSMSWLQILVVEGIEENFTRLDIWKMPQLRHVKIYDGIYLSDIPRPSSGRKRLVLENLQTLSTIINFKWSEEVVERIPNIKELRIEYNNSAIEATSPKDYRLDNLGRLLNLELLSIECYMKGWYGAKDFTLPYSLKELYLGSLVWDDATCAMIGGSLPFLQVLRLTYCAIEGGEWNSIEGQFCRLKSLELLCCRPLKCLDNVDSARFPCLEHLLIFGSFLEEFPWSIGDITTLQSIELVHASDSVIISAKQMLEEQEEQFANDTLVVEVIEDEKRKEFMEENFQASKNFKVRYS